MAYNNNYQNEDDSNKLAYDLRQSYAMIVGEHLADVANNRKANKLNSWYESLLDLKVIINHKVKDNTKLVNEKEILFNDMFKEMRNKLVKLANKYPDTWTGKNINSNHFHEIRELLFEMEEFLMENMEMSSMFGTGYIYDEDEI